MLGFNVDYKKVKVAKLRKDFGNGSFISENGQSNIEKKKNVLYSRGSDRLVLTLNC